MTSGHGRAHHNRTGSRGELWEIMMRWWLTQRKDPR